MKCLDLHGIVTHYQVLGEPGNPPLVFVNSLGADFRIWEAVAATFVRRYFVVLYDKRGHGLSSCPPGPYGLDDFSRDLSALVERLGLGRFTLVGISVGGQVAMRYALDQPQKVKALVLSNTAAKIGSSAYWHDRIGKIRKAGLEATAHEILPRWFSPHYPNAHPAAHAGYRHMLSRMPVEGYIGTCEALASADLRLEIGHLKVKTLVMTGAEDAGIPPQVARSLAASLPDAVYEEIPAAGHHPCIENPGAVVGVMRTFFQEQLDGPV